MGQQADDLAERLCGAFDYFKASCTRQTYYDWGLRKLKTVCKAAGTAGIQRRFGDERQMLTAAVQSSCSSSMSPIDQKAFQQGLINHFGVDAFVPMPVPGDFWNGAATKISRTVACRHGSLCLPVMESDETFVLAVIEEEATKLGARACCMPGRLAEFSQLELLGHFVDGKWRDGTFTKALRDVVTQPQPGWLVVFCGQEQFEKNKWNSFNTLLDDNKYLLLETGEKIMLKPQDRIVFAAQHVEGALPATISRLGVVNMEAHHRHRF